MVRLIPVFARIPTIKFRKGGLSLTKPSGSAGGPAAAPPRSGNVGAPPSHHMQSASAMSTSSVPDIDLPLRYRRLPLSDEEIEYINGGGIV